MAPTQVFGGAPGDIIGPDGVDLSPVTPAALFAECMAARTGPGYTNGYGSWNQFEWLRRMDAATFAAWCDEALLVPAISGGSETYGWLTGLSADGAGFFLTLAMQSPPLLIPNVRPDATAPVVPFELFAPVAPVVPIVPVIVHTQDAVPSVPNPAGGLPLQAQPAVVTVKTSQGFITHEAATLHAAIMKAIAWIEQEVRKL